MKYQSDAASPGPASAGGIRAFEHLGWQVARQKGSHIILTKRGHIATLAIPNHSQVACGTLRAVIAKAGLSIEQFIAAIDS